MKRRISIFQLLGLLFVLLAEVCAGTPHAEIFQSVDSSNPQQEEGSVSELMRISENYVYAGNLDSASYFNAKALSFPDITIEEKVALLSTQGTIHYYRSDYHDAIQSHLRALRICDENALEKQKARVFNNLGIAYIKLEEWVKAEHNMSKALEVSREFKIKKGELYCLGNLGIIYKNQGKIDLAIDTYKKSIALNNEMDDKKAMARNLNNLGALYEEQGDLTEAYREYEKGYFIGEELQNLDLLANAKQNMASVQVKREQYKKAETNYLEGLAMSEEIGNKDYQINTLHGLSDLFEKQQNFKKSLEYRKAYEALKDSVLNEQNLKTIRQLEVEYETEKKEKELLILNAEKERDAAGLLLQEKKINQLYFGLLLVFLIFVFSFIIYRQYASNKLKYEQIKAIEHTQNHERKRIAQDLHDSVGGALASIKMRLESHSDSDEKRTGDLKDLTSDISNVSTLLRQISHDIMPGELLRFGLVSAVQSHLDRMSKSGFVTNLYAHGLSQKIEFEIEINLYRIILEGIQNVLKHANAKTLNIHLNQHSKALTLLIEDDGNGFDPREKNGFGLNSIRNRVDLLEGRFQVDSTIGTGTTLSIEIPMS